MLVNNHSRHELNYDQRESIADAQAELGRGYTTFSGALHTHFGNAKKLRDALSGNVSVVVAPSHLLLELWAKYPNLSQGTTIIQFGVCQSAKKRGRFAATSITVISWEWDLNQEWCDPTIVHKAEIQPTVETDFRTGLEHKYGS